MQLPGDFSIRTCEDDAGTRLDTLLATHLAGCSRAVAARLIREGAVRVNGEVKKPLYRVKAGDAVIGRVPPPQPVAFEPEPIPLDVIFEDSHLLVVNKPPGLVVHPAPGNYSGTLVNALLFHCRDGLTGIGGELRPGIVHRLDKDTSGVLVVAKTAPAHLHLSQQFKSRAVRKTYMAIVHGEMSAAAGVIDLPIGRHPIDRIRMSTISRRVRAAETHWRVRERLGRFTLLDLDLKTGRTHQIRVHCTAIYHPVVGDSVYSGSKVFKNRFVSDLAPFKALVSRQMLHAWRLAFTHPATGRPMRFQSPPPQDMQRLLEALQQAVTATGPPSAGPKPSIRANGGPKRDPEPGG